MTDTLYYLGSPYQHVDPEIKKQRLAVVNWVSLQLLKEGRLVFSPLSHNLSIDFHRDFDSWQAWQRLDLTFLSRCDALLVLQQEGWEQSVGLKAEIIFAKEKQLPIHYLEAPSEKQIREIVADFPLEKVP